MLEAISEIRRLEEVPELNRKANSYWMGYWAFNAGASLGMVTLGSGVGDGFWFVAGASTVASGLAAYDSWKLRKLVKAVREVAHPDAWASVQMGKLKHSHGRRMIVLGAVIVASGVFGYLNSCAPQNAEARSQEALGLQTHE